MDKVIDFLESNVKDLSKDKFFLVAIGGTLLQCILFILLLSDGNAVRIHIKSAVIAVPPILVYISFVLIPYSFSFLLKGIGQRIFLAAVNLLISLFLIFDLWYYRSNSAFLNYYMFDMTDNLEGLSDSAFAMFRSVDLIFLATFAALVIMLVVSRRTNVARKRDLKKFGLLFLTPLIYLAYNHVKVDKLYGGYTSQYLFRRTWSQNQMMYNLTPLGYHIYDFYNYMEDKKPYVLSEDEISKINSFYSSKERNLPANSYSGIFKGKNLIVLQVESMENFVINEKIDGQEITPNINKLLENSLYFSNYREQTYNGTTSDATYVSNTSMLPVLVGNNNFNYPYNEYNSLPKLLKNEGYNTYSMHGEKGTYWNWMTAERNMGFDTTIDVTQFNRDETIGLGLSDGSFLSQAIEKLETQKTPFYTFMITLTSHSPFTIPEDQKTIKIPDNLKGTKTGGFIESINYTDNKIGKFMEELNKRGMLDNTVVAIYGDHEGVSKYFNVEVQGLSIPEKWKNNDRRVPLIIYSKSVQGQEFKVNGGQVDLLPTLSYLMGIDEEKYINTAMGRNLLNTNLDFAVLTNRTYRGPEISNEEKKKYTDTLDISNSIIKSNYFKER